MSKAYPTTHEVHYITTETEANLALEHIRDGWVGFDTEFVPRTLCEEEAFIEDIFNNVAGNKRSGMIVWQAMQMEFHGGFVIKWDNIGICIVQIARGNNVWLLNMTRIRAFPSELRRILTSYDIIKAGVGSAQDLPVIWNDLGCDMNNVVDCGLMVKLLLTEKYKETSYTNVSLVQSVEDMFQFKVDKEEQTSNWKGDANGDITDEQKKYAAIDAHASARLYEALAPALAKKAKTSKLVIPSSWYTFNGRYRMPVRTQRTVWNRDAPWSVADCTWFFGGKFQGHY
ncbi:ribonuclease H-like domain-containing protein [Mycena leptocephala]|nr:ribonuclease H-like domain-containing protein [Mycena leptocephala]